jgi:hypothetical protein
MSGGLNEAWQRGVRAEERQEALSDYVAGVGGSWQSPWLGCPVHGR